jgi:hypothetical protein
MNHSDPTAALAEMKRTEALLRDARSLLRRVDALAAMASASDDPSWSEMPSLFVTALRGAISFRTTTMTDPPGRDLGENRIWSSCS